MLVYAATIFLSAFLLFQVQPLIAKIILPWFGGSAAVWAAALLFFQLVLLAGYTYAHVLIRYLQPKMQMKVHAFLLTLSCALLPILPSKTWQPTVAGDPTLRILELLAATIGLPYFLLASTSPLLQAWYVRRSGSAMPYRLFALSNLGSMLALISFPFLIEPRLTSSVQAYTWSGAYVVFALFCAYAAQLSADAPTKTEVAPEPAAADAAGQRPGFAQMLLWVAFAACASTLLVSATNHLSQNVAPIPLLWVAPLALYLLSFILAFESDRIYQRWLFIPLCVVAIGTMAYMIWANSGNLKISRLIPGIAAGLFCCCMVCHGELARRRPAPQYLTSFYLMVSLGGAIGGVFVALIAPRVFHSYLELQVGLVWCAALLVLVTWNARMPRVGAWMLRIAIIIAVAILAQPKKFHIDLELNRSVILIGATAVLTLWSMTIQKFNPTATRVAMVVGMGLLCGYLVRRETEETSAYFLSVRNFYGVLRVKDDASQDPVVRTLLHGTINHGAEVLDDQYRYLPLSYYGAFSGVGRAMHALQQQGPIRVGVIGLGSGVMNAYARAGDVYRIYEINPLVEHIAQTEFGYYPHSPADKQILLGDARLVMERQPSQQFDIIVVDAFSSDAIPIHLLTREAFALYARHLKPTGILALHISNRYLDLAPVCERGAESIGRIATVVNDDGNDSKYEFDTTWVLVTSGSAWLENRNFDDANLMDAKAKSQFRGWTDDYSNIFQILKLD